MKLVSIVIPNYNGIEHLSVCLDSIAKQSYSLVEIIFVDNASTDGSVEFISEHYPHSKIVRQTKNEGFARAVNTGIQHSSGEYIALLNNDIELENEWLDILVNELEDHDELGSVACKMLNYYQRNIIDSAGDVLTRTGGAAARGYGEEDSGQYDLKDYVFGACAGAALYKREIFQTVGLFDEDFFAWFEDIDHDFRSQLLGYKCLYIPLARCYHKRGATGKKMYHRAVQLHVRNQIAYLIKNVPLQIFISSMPFIIGSRFKNWFTYCHDGFTLDVVHGLLESMYQLPRNIKKRLIIQRNKKVTIKYVNSLFVNTASNR